MGDFVFFFPLCFFFSYLWQRRYLLQVPVSTSQTKNNRTRIGITRKWPALPQSLPINRFSVFYSRFTFAPVDGILNFCPRASSQPGTFPPSWWTPAPALSIRFTFDLIRLPCFADAMVYFHGSSICRIEINPPVPDTYRNYQINSQPKQNQAYRQWSCRSFFKNQNEKNKTIRNRPF